jgi:hypothetical protein
MQLIKYLTGFIFFWCSNLSAQLNLVPNPGFEDSLECPYFVSQIDYANHWVTTKATPDYFHSCNNTSSVNTGWVGVPVNARGYQPARSGEAYAGIVSYYQAQADFREAFSTQLTQPLTAGQTYNVGMWVILMEDYARWAIDGGIGIHISTGPINPSQYFSYTPQIMNPLGNVLNDSLNWTLISGDYTAQGGENYITIGGFLPDTLLTLFDRGSGTGYNFTTYAIEDVFVTPPIGTGDINILSNASLVVYPNPCKDFISLTFNSLSKQSATVELFNILGEKIKTYSCNKDITIPLEDLGKGLYFLRISSGNNFIYRNFIKQ